MTQFQARRPIDSFTDVVTNATNIIEAKRKLNADESSGIDKLNPMVIKKVSAHLIYSLKLLVSYSAGWGIIPDD